MRSREEYEEIGRETVQLVRTKNVDFLSAGIAFYAFFALVPLSLLVFILLGLVGGDVFARQFVLSVAELLTPSNASVLEVLEEVLLQVEGRRAASALGLFVLLWGGMQLFRAINIAFSSVNGADRNVSIVEEIKDALTALFVVGTAVTITITAGAAITVFPGLEMVGLIWTIAQFVGLTVIFLPLYHVFSSVDYTWSELLPGAVVAALGWTMLQHLFRLYAGHLSSSIYSVFGGVILLIAWMYVGSFLVLVGFIVNQVRVRQELDT